MNNGKLSIFSAFIVLTSFGIYLGTTWQPSKFSTWEPLIPALLLLISFFVPSHNKRFRPMLLAAVIAALGFLSLHFYINNQRTILHAAAILATAPFFYSYLNVCCDKANDQVEQKLHYFTESSLFFCLCIFAAGVGLTTQIIFSCSTDIWYDEAFSLALTAHPWSEMMALAASDVHPPLYYIILKALTSVAHLLFPYASSICIAKFVSVLPYALLLVVAISKVRRTWGNYVGGLWGMALFAAPSLITQGIEIRMYSWAMFFVTMAYLSAYDVYTLGRKRDWCLFTLAGLASAYTHYYACIAVTPVYLLLLYNSFKKGRRAMLQWAAAGVITVAGYLPWLFIFLNQARTVCNDYWIVLPNTYSYWSLAKGLFFTALTASFVFLLIFQQIHSFYHDKENRKRTLYILTGIFCCASAIVVGLALTYLIRPIFLFRYVYPGLACFWLALIIASKTMGRATVKFSFFLILLGGYLSLLLLFVSTEDEAAKEHHNFIQQLDRNTQTVPICDYRFGQLLMSTLMGKTCLCFDKLENPESLRKVFSDCDTPDISDIQAFLSQKSHPAYMLLLFKQNDELQAMLQQYHTGRFMESAEGYFDMYVIPATENETQP